MEELVYQYTHNLLIDVANKMNVLCEVTNISRSINDGMPSYCVREAIKLLKFSDLPKSKVTILGLAFRGDVSDTRLSPTYAVITELQKFGIKNIRIHDPFVSNDPNLLKYDNVSLTSDLKKAVKDSDLIILSTDHQEYKKLGKKFLEISPFMTVGVYWIEIWSIKTRFSQLVREISKLRRLFRLFSFISDTTVYPSIRKSTVIKMQMHVRRHAIMCQDTIMLTAIYSNTSFHMVGVL